MELTEPFILREISVPNTNNLVNGEFSSQVARYPSVREVHKNKFHRLKMLQGHSVNLLNNCFHFVEHLVNARLHFCVVILDVRYKFCQAPENIRLHFKEATIREVR